MRSSKQNSCLLVSLDQCAPLLLAGPGFPVPKLAVQPLLAWNTVKPAGRDTAIESTGGREREEKGGMWLVLSFWNLLHSLTYPGRWRGWREKSGPPKRHVEHVSALAKCEHTKTVFQKERTWNNVVLGETRILHFTRLIYSLVLMLFRVTYGLDSVSLELRSHLALVTIPWPPQPLEKWSTTP